MPAPTAVLNPLLRHPLADAVPLPGNALPVAPGILWVRMGLPFALNHINLWLLRDELDGRQGWTIVDCGLGNDATREAWEQVFAAHLDGLPVLRVIVTHLHPDHIGNSAWLVERWTRGGHDCRMWSSAGEFYGAQLAMQNNSGAGGERAAAFFASHGLTDPEAQDGIRRRSGYYTKLVPALPTRHVRMIHGQEIQVGAHAESRRNTWRCIAGYGHSPEHISLYNAGLGILIAGDMVLPRISTNVSVHDTEPEADALGLYLHSLDALRPLPADTLVLPSHGHPFIGLHTRIDELHAHHEARLAETREACAARPTSAAELLAVLFKRPLDLHQTTFAMGEAVAHLNRLWHAGELSRSQGEDGVWRFALK